ncbi:MAG: MOSC domain-containing protein [Candidatus Binatia bacterium]
MKTVGRIRELWRYPVKSMGGEAISECRLTAGGIPGDRAWALRDEAAAEIRGAKKFPSLLRCSARFLAEPEPGESPAAEIVLPDGRRVRSDAPEASTELSALVGRQVTLCPLRPADDLDHYRRGMPDNPDMLVELREIFGREADEPLPDLSVFPAEIMEFTSPLGTYFDAFPLHFVTTATLAEMAVRAPASNFDSRRFRPNFVIETSADAGSGLVETGWSGRDLRVGGARIRALMPTVRCSMITQPQGDLAKDPGVLRAVVRDADQNLGSYAIVVEAGIVREGDEVVLLD